MNATVPATLRVCVLFLAPCLCGCTYLQNRALDFTDILAVGGSTGGSIQVRARATRALTLEVGAQKDECYYGWRRRSGQWEESSYGLFLASVWSPRLGNEPFAKWSWLDVLKTSHTRTHYLSIDAKEDWRYHVFLLTHAENARWIDGFDVEVAFGALFIGLQVAIRPGELADLLAGLVTLDPAGDDKSSAAPAEGAEGKAGAAGSTER